MIPIEIYSLSEMNQEEKKRFSRYLRKREALYYHYFIAKSYIDGNVMDIVYSQNPSIPSTNIDAGYQEKLDITEEFFIRNGINPIPDSEEFQSFWNIFFDGELPQSTHERVLTPSITNQDITVPAKFLTLRARKRSETQKTSRQG